MPCAPTPKEATSANASLVSPETPSLHALIWTNARPKRTSVDSTPYAGTPIRDSVASAPQASVETPTLRAKRPTFGQFANQTLTAPTMPCVRAENACVARASQPLAPSAWMLTSVAPPLESVDLTPSARIPAAPTPAPAHPPLWETPPPCLARSLARELPAVSTPTVRRRRRTPTVSARMVGPTTHRTSPLDVSMSMSVEPLEPAERMLSARTFPAATCVSASLATPATRRFAVWI